MPTFGPTSRKHLATCHGDIQIIMSKVILIVDCSILEGHRSNTLQQEYFDRGLSQKGPGESKHNSTPSMAWHVMPYFKTKPHIDWTHWNSMYYLAGVIVATAERLQLVGQISHVVRSGLDWDRDGDVREKQWNDGAHFELISF